MLLEPGKLPASSVALGFLFLDARAFLIEVENQLDGPSLPKPVDERHARVARPAGSSLERGYFGSRLQATRPCWVGRLLRVHIGPFPLRSGPCSKLPAAWFRRFCFRAIILGNNGLC